MKIAFVSLGCAKNQVDTETMAGMLAQAGHSLVLDESQAQAVIINTCSFIQAATQESVDILVEYAQLKAQGQLEKLVVCGCLAKRYARELKSEIPEIDAFLGPQELEKIVQVMGDGITVGAQHVIPARIYSTPPSYAYLKIADGCNNRCSYCIIPSLRGSYRSQNRNTIIEEARQIVTHGFHEIMLIAQDTTSFGQDTGERLEDLLMDLLGLEGLGWLRLMYTYPTRISDELLEILSHHERACPYLDLPLQHISDSVLSRMGRKGRKQELYALTERIKSAGISLRTTFMVGFPGETEAEFQELLDFVREVEVDHLGSFTYSPEEGTPAAAFPGQIPEAEMQRRQEELMLLQQDISRRKLEALRGSIQQVLVDGTTEEDGFPFRGHTRRFAPEVDGAVYLDYSSLSPGQVVQARIVNSSEYDLQAEVI